MEDIASKLTELLNNPESLNKLKGLSGLLGKNFDDNKKTNDQPPIKNNDTPEIPIEAMSAIMKVMPILSSVNKEDNETRLLLALKPLLGLERQKKIDQSIHMMQMMKIMPLLKNKELFS